MRQRRFGEAAEAFRAAASLPLSRALSHYHLARALIEVAGQAAGPEARSATLAEAEAELGRAWELSDGRLTAVHVERARIYERRGDFEGAAREVEAYLAAEPRAANAAALRAAIAKLRKVGKE
jgi:hypothetical protein